MKPFSFALLAGLLIGSTVASFANPVSGQSSAHVQGISNPPLMPAASPSNQSREDLLSKLVGFGRMATGGRSGALCIVNTLEDSGSGSLRNCAESSATNWILFYVSGTISLKKPINIRSNKTIDGRGQSIVITNYGIRIVNMSNVIITNITISDAVMESSDGITVFNSKNVWIDHVSIANTADGALDITSGSTDVTVSWCKFERQNKTMLVGADNDATGDADIRLTLHHNFFMGTIRRNPLVRFAKVHMFNNLIKNWGDGTAGDAVATTFGAQIYSEANVFEAGINKTAVRLTVGETIPIPGYIKLDRDLGLNGAKLLSNEPGRVFDPRSAYQYTAAPADASLSQEIERSAGAQNVSAPWL